MDKTRDEGLAPGGDTLTALKLPGGGAPVPGMVIGGKFALQREIASGGMGVVFEGRDLFIERPVAIKLMHPDLVEDPTLVARFRREAQAAARIQHPHVVTVHEVGSRRDGTFYIVQELLVGQTLRDVLEARVHLEPSEVFSVAIPIMGGLIAAHCQKIVHRDIKPENVILAETPSGEVVPKIIDFGIAKLQREVIGQSLTNVGDVMGTPEYMAPEQVRGERIDERADVWAMGVMLFEMLSGRIPFEGSPYELLLQILDRPVPSLASFLPEHVGPIAAVVQRAIERDLDKRIQTMAQFREELLAAYGRGAVVDPVAMIAPIRLTQTSIARRLSQLGVVADPEWSPTDELDGEPSLPSGQESSPGPTPESGTPSIRFDVAAEPLEMAEQALAMNALHEAIGWAELAVPSSGQAEDERGRALMVLAVAHRWLGAHADAVRSAQGALARLARGTPDWHAAFGELVIAYGYLGRTERLLALVDELRADDEEDDDMSSKTEPQIMTLCRLSVFVLRAGVPALAERLVAEARAGAKAITKLGPETRAWLDVAAAELALHSGHLAAFLRSVERAIDLFTAASDVRSACLERAHAGEAHLYVGAWDRAAALLRETLAVAEPMQLEFVATARANLGFAIARGGRVEEGIAVTEAALDSCVRQGNRRAESLSCILLARLFAEKGDPAAAEMARRAVRASEGLPARRAYALAALANALIVQGNPEDATAHIEESVRIVERLGGVPEGDAFIRLVQIASLRGRGEAAMAADVVASAKKRLLEKAHRIGDPDVRRSFLERVPENVGLVAS